MLQASTLRIPKIVPITFAFAVSGVFVGALAHRPARLPTITRGGEGPPTLLLLHGYGATAAQWEPFTHTIAVPPRARFVFPVAPEVTVPPDGPIGGRAWWRLALEEHIPPGRKLPDLSTTHPTGMDVSVAAVRPLLRDLERSPGGPLVLGGFSQGAMVAAGLAFTGDEPLAALVLLSVTPVDEASWRRAAARRRGLRVFISHGRADATLPFAAAERLARELSAAGLAVTWVPFDGGHAVPTEVVTALNAFLAPILHVK
jgi:phospholipase/carboxylesterase